MVEFKQKEKLGTFLQAKTGFGRRKGRETIHLLPFYRKTLREKKRESLRKKRKEGRRRRERRRRKGRRK